MSSFLISEVKKPSAIHKNKRGNNTKNIQLNNSPSASFETKDSEKEEVFLLDNKDRSNTGLKRKKIRAKSSDQDERNKLNFKKFVKNFILRLVNKKNERVNNRNIMNRKKIYVINKHEEKVKVKEKKDLENYYLLVSDRKKKLIKDKESYNQDIEKTLLIFNKAPPKISHLYHQKFNLANDNLENISQQGKIPHNFCLHSIINLNGNNNNSYSNIAICKRTSGKLATFIYNYHI